jgi:conjugal transfer pilus assembly protein TraW
MTDDEWLQRSREIIERASQEPVPDWLRTDPGEDALALANQILEQSKTMVSQDDPDQTQDVLHSGRVLIFGSLSIPRTTFKNLLLQATDPDVLLILRGVSEGSDVVSMMKSIRVMTEDWETQPNVIIDPTAFKRHHVTVVPTMVYRTSTPSGAMNVRVEGAVTVNYLIERATGIKQYQPLVNLGIQAETYSIAERDLIDEIKARMARIDWAQKKQAAIEGFWKKRKMLDLPIATADRQFEIDPSVRVTQDILNDVGEVLVAAGTVLNPLDIVPLSKTVYVFDGTDARQIAFVAALAEKNKRAGRGVILIATKIDVNKGGEALFQLETTFSRPVYLLQDDVATRFRLERVPSVVVGKGNRLVVNEYAIKESGNE